MLIKSTNVRSARIMDFFQVMSNVKNFLLEENLEELQLTKYANEFSDSLESLDKALLQAQKTGYTKQIVAADNLRNSILTGFLSCIRGMKYFPDKNISESAGRIFNTVTKYGSNIQRLPQREETAILTNLIQDLNEEKISLDLIKTGLNMWVDKLEDANKKFDELYVARTQKESEFIVGLTRSEREKMQNVFENLCKAINSLSFLNDASVYKRLAEKINVDVSKVQKAIKARSAGKSSELDELEELPPSSSFDEMTHTFDQD